MRRLIVSVIFATLAFNHNAYADPNPVPELGSGVPIILPDNLFNDTYRIGDEWGKVPVRLDDLDHSGQLQYIAKATGQLNGATSFYIGEYDGVHVLATNNHVCPKSCLNRTVHFPLLDVKARVTEFFGTWPAIDLALMAIEIPAEHLADLKAAARPFDFTSPTVPGQELITVGFGRGDNPLGKLVANQDSDCKVFSGHDEFRLMADPDELNPGQHKTWSFAHGCDVSHGDSGSAMVDRASGRIIGVLWTGRIPKSAKVQSSDYLDEMLASQSEEIWQELSYGVPAKKIAEYLNGEIANGAFDTDTTATIEAVLNP